MPASSKISQPCSRLPKPPAHIPSSAPLSAPTTTRRISSKTASSEPSARSIWKAPKRGGRRILGCPTGRQRATSRSRPSTSWTLTTWNWTKARNPRPPSSGSWPTAPEYGFILRYPTDKSATTGIGLRALALPLRRQRGRLRHSGKRSLPRRVARRNVPRPGLKPLRSFPQLHPSAAALSETCPLRNRETKMPSRPTRKAALRPPFARSGYRKNLQHPGLNNRDRHRRAHDEQTQHEAADEHARIRQRADHLARARGLELVLGQPTASSIPESSGAPGPR